MEGIYGFVYEAFHSLDEPFNAWPCLHIAQSFIIAVALSRWWRQLKWNWAVCLLWPAWLGLFISVMTTKQHFIWDSITGTLLGVGVWLTIMRPGFRHLDSVADDDLPLAKLG
jgi:membrane-associated phospholipid phosphatase